MWDDFVNGKTVLTFENEEEATEVLAKLGRDYGLRWFDTNDFSTCFSYYDWNDPELAVQWGGLITCGPQDLPNRKRVPASALLKKTVWRLSKEKFFADPDTEGMDKGSFDAWDGRKVEETGVEGWFVLNLADGLLPVPIPAEWCEAYAE